MPGGDAIQGRTSVMAKPGEDAGPKMEQDLEFAEVNLTARFIMALVVLLFFGHWSYRVATQWQCFELAKTCAKYGRDLYHVNVTSTPFCSFSVFGK